VGYIAEGRVSSVDNAILRKEKEERKMVGQSWKNDTFDFKLCGICLKWNLQCGVRLVYSEISSVYISMNMSFTPQCT
jgi:hypothetical protein